MLSEQVMALPGTQPQFPWMLCMTPSPSSVKLKFAQSSVVSSPALFGQPILSSSVRMSLVYLTT